MKIRDISKTQPKIYDISKKAERVEPEEVAKVLGAERFSDIEKTLREKIEKAVELTHTNKERQHLIKCVMISAEMQGLIKAWRHSIYENQFIYEVQISFPFLPKILMAVQMVEE
jgi:hypothetical protein